ncbi:hypothetical protein BCR35DRAFT_312226 [Leucosporidium creatinivorum]|uniref:F-box domain-containing protein n=1 Tax=Leucosporidium creatinivorum TaxID=106004 RepID=A0A1Y2G1N5_9BASI|nr:hypothetical protein BCR35DRAFT_312226 [Leucosporidium creatinivorum]
MPQPNLTDEIIKGILNEMGPSEPATKANVALACRRFLPLGRAALYHSISFQSDDPDSRDLEYVPAFLPVLTPASEALLDTLADNPRLGDLVRSISLDLLQVSRPHAAALIRTLLKNYCKKTEALEVAELAGCRPLDFEDTLEEHGKKLRSFTAESVVWGPGGFSQALGGMKKLESLTLIDSLDKWFSADTAGPRPTFRLKHLDINHHSLTNDVFDFLTRSSRRSLETLTLPPDLDFTVNLSLFKALRSMQYVYSGRSYSKNAQNDLKALAKCPTLQLLEIADDGSAGGKITGWEAWDLLGNLPPAVSHLYVGGLNLLSSYILKSLQNHAVAPTLSFIQLGKIIGGGRKGSGGVQRTVGEMRQIDQVAEARGLSVVWAGYE